MYLCKRNHASSEKNVSCGSISPSTTDCRNQLQNWALLAVSRGYKAWITVVLQGLSFSNCVVVLALDFDTLVSWAGRRFSDFLGVCSRLAPVSSNLSSVSTLRLCFRFLSIKSPVVLRVCTRVWIVCVCSELFYHEIYVDIFADTFWRISISHRL
jgi:hypothetical protein